MIKPAPVWVTWTRTGPRLQGFVEDQLSGGQGEPQADEVFGRWMDFVCLPNPAQIEAIHTVIENNLVRNKIRNESRAIFQPFLSALVPLGYPFDKSLDNH